jgi:hypothetical protein
MRYIQLVEFDSSESPEVVRAALGEWLTATQGKRTLQTLLIHCSGPWRGHPGGSPGTAIGCPLP